jgi:hypothetical protein
MRRRVAAERARGSERPGTIVEYFGRIGAAA